ncbi:MAG: glycosyltransferase, partial [Alphaproteobacteria bacterium]|nr:glycosyltransferase [Alphaproteobacteria bacterium]
FTRSFCAISFTSICSRAGGLPEVVEHDVSGMLFPVGDYKAMGRAAITLLEDDNRRLRMGKAARESSVKNYAQDLIIPQYEELYWELAAERAHRVLAQV